VKRVLVFLEPSTRALLEKAKQETGSSFSVQVERALRKEVLK